MGGSWGGSICSISGCCSILVGVRQAPGNIQTIQDTLADAFAPSPFSLVTRTHTNIWGYMDTANRPPGFRLPEQDSRIPRDCQNRDAGYTPPESRLFRDHVCGSEIVGSRASAKHPPGVQAIYRGQPTQNMEYIRHRGSLSDHGAGSRAQGPCPGGLP